MVGSALRDLRPLWKYSWPNGEELYIGESGEVLQYTTPSSRLAAYVSAVPHWLYFTSLRKHQPFWIRFATYSAFVGTAGAIIGVVVGVWLYSPAKKYRFAGAPSRIPYRGWKRWHTVFGLVFGVATITWTFSGSLAPGAHMFETSNGPLALTLPGDAAFTIDGATSNDAAKAASAKITGGLDLFSPDGFNAAQMVVRAIGEGGDDVEKMIGALEGWSFDGVKGKTTIRKDDHAMIQPMFQVKLVGVGPAAKPQLVKELTPEEVTPPAVAMKS